jgi:hypothetical protein
MSRRFYAEVPLRELAKIRKTLVNTSQWGGGRCRECGNFAFDGEPHKDGCHVKAALDILDRNLTPRGLKPKLVKSLKQARSK